MTVLNNAVRMSEKDLTLISHAISETYNNNLAKQQQQRQQNTSKLHLGSRQYIYKNSESELTACTSLTAEYSEMPLVQQNNNSEIDLVPFTDAEWEKAVSNTERYDPADWGLLNGVVTNTKINKQTDSSIKKSVFFGNNHSSKNKK
eukprot:UN09000